MGRDMVVQRVVLLLVLSGCAPERGTLTIADDPVEPDLSDTEGDTEEAEVPVEPGPCANPILAVKPLDNDADVPLGASIEVRLTVAEPLATLRLRSDGRDVPSRTVVAEDRLVLEPLAPVRAGALYDLTTVWSCGQATTRFTTASETWRVETRAGTLAAPSASEALTEALATLLDPMLLGLDGLGGGRAEWLLAASVGVRQDRCAPTTRLTGGVGVELSFEATGGIAELPAGASVVPARSVRLSGTLEVAQRTLDALNLEAVLDLRPVASRLGGLGGDVAAVCNEVEAGCLRCPDGVEACVLVRWEGLPTSRGGPPVVRREPADVAADPACR